jgi:hypothetical protein
MWRDDRRFVTVKGVVGASWRASRSEDAKARTRSRWSMSLIKRSINPKWVGLSYMLKPGGGGAGIGTGTPAGIARAAEINPRVETRPLSIATGDIG